MEYVDVLQVFTEIGPFFGSKNAERQADEGPEMNRVISAVEMIVQIVNLTVAVVAGRNTICSSRRFYLIEFQFSVRVSGFRVPGLQISPPSAAAVVVGAVRLHVDEVLLSDDGLDDEAKVFCDRIAEGFSDELAGILYRELDFSLPVPCRADLQLAFPNPLRIVLDNALDLETGFDAEFLQSGPDCEEFVPSLRIEPHTASQIMHRLGLDLHDMLPAFVVGQKHAVIFCGPSFGAVGPIGSDKVENLP